MATLLTRLQGLEEFVAVAETRSFVRAAEMLGVTSSGVGKAVGRLEQRVGVRLFHRTTRKVSLTEEGAAFLAHCKAALNDLAEAERTLDQTHSEPQGLLRIDMPVAYGRIVLMPLIAAFRRAYPKVTLQLQLSDRLSDFVEDRLDVVFRIGELADSSFVAKPFDSISFGAYAGAQYVKRLGSILHPNELPCSGLLCFHLTNGRPFQFQFTKDGEKVTLSPGNTIVSNDIEAVMEAAANDLGIVFLPTFLAKSASAATLVPLLTDWQVKGPPVHLLYPSARQLSRRVRAFVDFVTSYR